MLRHHRAGSEDGEHEGDPAPDCLLSVEHALLGHEELFLVVDSPTDDGAAVQVDRTHCVVATVHHHHGDLRHGGALICT